MAKGAAGSGWRRDRNINAWNSERNLSVIVEILSSTHIILFIRFGFMAVSFIRLP
jgi:hypothetical protein